MKTAEILRELIKRQVDSKLNPIRLQKEEETVKRSLFLKKLLDSNGESLLQFIEIGVPNSIPSRDVFNHIRAKVGVGFNKKQQAVIKYYLKQLGAVVYKKMEAHYYINLKLKE